MSRSITLLYLAISISLRCRVCAVAWHILHVCSRTAQRGKSLCRLYTDKGLHGFSENVGLVHLRVGQFDCLGIQGIVNGDGGSHQNLPHQS